MMISSSVNASSWLIKRELLLAFRHPADILNPLLFFVIVVTLFPLALNPETHLLQNIAPGIIWVAALLATLISLDKIFRHDLQEGFLDQLMLSKHSIYILIISKIFAHWLITGLPILLLSPLLALQLHLPPKSMLVLSFSLLLGTPILSLIGAIFAALTVRLRSSSLLLPLLVLPFYIPVLIFGAGSVAVSAQNLSAAGELAVLGAILALSIPLAPLGVKAALSIGE